MLYGVKPTDPMTYAAVVAVLGGIALVRAAIPARRAMRVDPIPRPAAGVGADRFAAPFFHDLCSSVPAL